MLTQHNTHPVC